MKEAVALIAAIFENFNINFCLDFPAIAATLKHIYNVASKQ